MPNVTSKNVPGSGLAKKAAVSKEKRKSDMDAILGMVKKTQNTKKAEPAEEVGYEYEDANGKTPEIYKKGK